MSLKSSQSLKSLKSLKDPEHPHTAKSLDNESKDEEKREPVKFKIVFERAETIKTSSNLRLFHKELGKHKQTMLERYGWLPKYEARMKSDQNASILSFAITENDEIAGMASMLPLDIDKVKELMKMYDTNNNNNDNITNINDHMDALFADSDEEDNDDKYDENYEIAMVVFPKFQRRGIGTLLTQKTWEKFGKPTIRCIGLVQSQKSSKFMQRMKHKMTDVPLVLFDPRGR